MILYRAVDEDRRCVVHSDVEHLVAFSVAIYLHIPGEDVPVTRLALYFERALRDTMLGPIEMEAQHVSLRRCDLFWVVDQASFADIDIMGSAGLNDGHTAQQEVKREDV